MAADNSLGGAGAEAERPSTIGGTVARLARQRPQGVAFTDARTGGHLTWAGYFDAAQELAGRLVARLGEPAGSPPLPASDARPRPRVAVAVPDGVAAHVAFLGCELAGVIAVGIGARSGTREVTHIVRTSRAAAVVSTADLAGAMDLADHGLPLVMLDAPIDAHPGQSLPTQPFDPHELWFLNSTSGTTGLPKLVRHQQHRWFAFHDEAQLAARFTADDVFSSLLPAPFGFGLWTADFTPTILGRPCVVADRFDPEVALAAIERERVTVLAAVPTQLALLLSARSFATTDFSSLRVVFTGGEMLPYPRAVEFEDRTGAVLLQFYGATETGALSRTTLDDSRDVRLRTAGRLLRTMHVRLVDDDDRDVTALGGPAVPVCRGPLLSLGYDGDDEANARLCTADGSMRMPDLVTIDPPGDPDGVLTVVGRTTDLIIRGGKNISAAQVEDEVATHPAVGLAAAVPIPDPVFGERVCVFVVPAGDGEPIDLARLTDHLRGRGVGRELWPEHLILVDGDLPRNAGGKVAKAVLRARAAEVAAAGPA